MIPPLLLFPFVENSFKHGASESLQDPWVSISAATDGGRLTMKIENSKEIPPTGRAEKFVGGIGVTNVRTRLDLLYKGSYELNIADGEGRYAVMLNLPLGSNSPGRS